MTKVQNLVGQKFGLLTVIELDHPVQKINEKGQKDGILYYYKCLCECGQEKIVNGFYLLGNRVKSCGCLKHKGTHFTHGLGKPDTFSHWVNMKTRCLNKNNVKYKNYGGRGITICDEWLSFENFHYWTINNGFNKDLTLERIDVNGNYEPSNCTWITMEQQAKNKRNSKIITYNGLTMNVAEWSKYLGLGRETVRERLKNGWSIKDALSPKKRSREGRWANGKPIRTPKTYFGTN